MSSEKPSLINSSDAASNAMLAADQAKEDHSLLSLAGDFGKAALNSAIERPINGLAQFSNHVLGTNMGQMHTFDLDRPTSTAQSIVEQAGGAFGTMVPFMVARGGVRFMSRSVVGLSESTSLLGVAGENAATGFTMGFLMNPTDERSGDNFFLARAKQGVVDAGTFAALGATQKYLEGKFAPAAEVAETMPLRARIARSSLMGAASGLPAGFVNAELQSVMDGHGLASKEAIAGDMAGFAAFGALMGPLDAFLPTGERARPRPENELEAMYAQRSSFQEAMGRAAVRHDLSLHRAYDVEANGLGEGSVLDKFKSEGFTPAQENFLMTMLAYVREGFANQRGRDGKIEPDQKGNWLHTLDEFDAGLDITRGMPSEFRTKMLLAMFGDSWKTKKNFTWHNLDGAEVAKIVAGRYVGKDGFTAEDLLGAVESNKEHQVSPSGLMGILYANKISSVINAERGAELKRLNETAANGTADGAGLSAGDAARREQLQAMVDGQNARAARIAELSAQEKQGGLSEAETQELAALKDRNRYGAFFNDHEHGVLSSLQRKIADPYSFELERTPEGGMAVKLTRQATPDGPMGEQDMLKLAGPEYWHIPHPDTPWFKESRMGVMADILANLGPGGRRKLTGLNGPETEQVFEFPRIRQCVDSGLKTYADIDKILSPEEYQYVQNRLGNMNGAIDQALSRVGDWLRSLPENRDNPNLENVPFWSSDLVYPNRGEFEADWRTVNRIPSAQRTAEQQAFWEAHRFDGLSESQKQDYLRAIEIRNRTVEELGRELRRDDQYVPDFRPVMRRNGLLGVYDTVQARRQNAPEPG
jgi:hypothetical protein